MSPDLTVLGLTALEAELYDLLVDNPPLTREAITDRWGRTGHEVSAAALLARLEQSGLITSLAGEVERIAAVSPEVALSDLAERRIAHLAQIKVQVIQEYGRRWAQGEHDVDPRNLIEIVVGRSAIVQRVQAIERAAGEVLGFDKPPYASPDFANAVQDAKLLEGVTYRSIYEGAALELPGKMDSIQSSRARGEQARVAWGLPMKMVMADRQIAIVPLESAPEAIEVAAIVHPSALLDSLYMLFEMLWALATPIGDPRSSAAGAIGGSADTPAGPDSNDQHILTLLAAGLTDKAVARQLGVTERTVQRWVKQLMTDYGAHTRLQLGLKLAQTGTTG